MDVNRRKQIEEACHIKFVNLDGILVQLGKTIKDILGIVGESCRGSGNTLHYRIFANFLRSINDIVVK